MIFKWTKEFQEDIDIEYLANFTSELMNGKYHFDFDTSYRIARDSVMLKFKLSSSCNWTREQDVQLEKIVRDYLTTIYGRQVNENDN